MSVFPKEFTVEEKSQGSLALIYPISNDGLGNFLPQQIAIIKDRINGWAWIHRRCNSCGAHPDRLLLSMQAL